MYKLKVWQLLAAVAIAGTLLSACSNSAKTSTPVRSTETNSKPSFWYINPLESYPLYNDSAKLFEDSASKLGYRATVVGSPTVDIPQQITYIKEAVADGAKAIDFCDIDPATYSRTIKQAEAKGVIMITTGGCVDTISDYSVGTNNVEFGQAAAQTIAKDRGPNAHIIIFGTNATTSNQEIQINSFKSYAARHYPKMKILAYEADNADAATAATDMAAALAAYPTVNAFWFVEGAGPAAVPKTLQHAGKKPGQIFVLGIDATPSTLAAIKAGWISATIAQCYFWATPFTAQLALARLAGHGPKQRAWNVGVQAVTKADLPYHGCPASFIPHLPSGK